MHPNTLREKLYGVIAFPVTPFKDNLSLDLPGLHHNLTKLLEHPISAVVAAGGTGEMYSHAGRILARDRVDYACGGRSRAGDRGRRLRSTTRDRDGPGRGESRR